MQKEYLPKTVDGLQSYRKDLESLFESRQGLYNSIGAGQITELTNPLKVGRSRARVEGSQLRLLEKMQQVDAQIDRENLIQQARAHRDRKSVIRREVEELEKYAKHLSPETLARKRMEYDQIRTSRQTDEGLIRGYQLLEAREKEEQERFNVPQTEVNPNTKEVKTTVGDVTKSVVLLDVHYVVLDLLARNPNTPVRTTEISSARDAGSRTMFQNREIIEYLRSQLEPDPENPQVIVTHGRGSSLGYELRGKVLLIPQESTPREEETPPPARPRRPIEYPVDESRINPLTLIFTDSEATMSDLLTTMGQRRDGKPFTWPTAKTALKNGVKKLETRIGGNLANDKERELWQLLKESANQQKDSQVARSVNARIDQWFDDNKPAKKTENKPKLELKEEKIRALQLLFENPDAIPSDITRALPKSSHGNELHWQQARYSLINGIVSLRARFLRNLATPEERALYLSIAQQIPEVTQGKAIYPATARKLNEWYEEKMGRNSDTSDSA